MKNIEMKVYALVFVVVISLMTIGAVWAAERQFREPTIEERPVVERRLVCPEGFELYKIEKDEKRSCNSCFVVATGTSNYGLVNVDPKGVEWQQGSLPNLKEHVCVTKEEANKHEHAKE